MDSNKNIKNLAQQSAGKSWFSKYFGFLETEDYQTNQKGFNYDKGSFVLKCLNNGSEFYVGPFESISVQTLSSQLQESKIKNENKIGGLKQSVMYGDIRQLHQQEINDGAVIMVASQFNALEMVGPRVTPEKGITRYQTDQTQGPACAIACPAGTVFRNYFVNGTGQGGGKQLNLLTDVEQLLKKRYWNLENGYTMPLNGSSMAELGERMLKEENLYASVVNKLKVGIHWETQVGSTKLRVCQVFCSAVPVTYCHLTKRNDWEPFACAILDGAYEATLSAAAIIAMKRGKRVRVLLTQLGNGAFGNNIKWINEAIDKAVLKHINEPLDVFVVKFGTNNSN